MKVLGISGSLRNARFGVGSQQLISELQSLDTESELKKFLQDQTRLCVEDFISAGLSSHTPFDQVYENLQKRKGDRGLSNSEAALAAGLWGSIKEGALVEHVSLAPHFPMNGKPRRLEQLKKSILESDALLVAGPVYFGDRGSLVQALIDFLSNDGDLREHCAGKVYAGIAVGAKRNGGQETQLIYQLIDMCNLNMLAVGNSHKTSAQYGGTVVAGDVGTAWSDEYGLETSIGTGRRLAQVAKSRETSRSLSLKNRTKIGIWLVQDSDDQVGLTRINKWINDSGRDDIDYRVLDLTHQEIYRCIACDLCPTHHAVAEEYACIIKAGKDFFLQHHAELVTVDAVLLAAYSPANRQKTTSVYQQFMERSRYLRRANYLLGDRLVAPLIITELNANQNLHIRMLTSLIRHHTIIHHPLIAVENQGEVINEPFFLNQLESFAKEAIEQTKSRLSRDLQQTQTSYNPIGYHISAERNQDDHRQGIMTKLFNEQHSALTEEKSERLNST
ncbi:MAG: NAD(P)H-dependent oxidoreductase [Gammaproteobacteria bacterium]|nr:NAD(P)H-dependent oxidoreductase [Gammaproteobacteria bacterium]